MENRSTYIHTKIQINLLILTFAFSAIDHCDLWMSRWTKRRCNAVFLDLPTRFMFIHFRKLENTHQGSALQEEFQAKMKERYMIERNHLYRSCWPVWKVWRRSSKVVVFWNYIVLNNSEFHFWQSAVGRATVLEKLWFDWRNEFKLFRDKKWIFMVENLSLLSILNVII